ncbi:serine hydrolase domain-containing protein [Labedella endophytica]|uniref:Class A beta-lactamase-related serine hydrolase n=1 Tax=Labedella endophytica TaxID=1523160 RepID=A0A3S0VVN2_9MICO|nr:serine hydrolase domain-containing protein [Labedella endophytica]RUR03169.1 class A beta-lactamase-related serine hydrolase [Labedella endophytica]
MSSLSDSSPVEVHGAVDPRFEALRPAFERAFDGSSGVEQEMGAALAVRYRGEPVVDLWGGVADARDGRSWVEDTASVVFSATKGIMSLLAARLVQDGLLEYDAPVARYWPEFAASGKSHVLVRHALAHRAGLSAPRLDLTRDDLLDWNRMTAALAEQEPLWEPGSGYSYHALTHGWLVGELVRRVTGLMPGDYLRSVLTGPLGADFWLGLPESERIRLAPMTVGPSLAALTREQEEARRPGVIDWPARAMTLGAAFPPELIADGVGFNDVEVLAAEVPGAGGVGTARALAAMWSSAVVTTDGVRSLDDAVVEAATREQTSGRPVFDLPGPWPRWGMGFQLDSDARRLLTPASFGHDGAGGQVAFADPRHEIGFAFLTNRMEAGDDRRATRIVDALRDVLEG